MNSWEMVREKVAKRQKEKALKEVPKAGKRKRTSAESDGKPKTKKSSGEYVISHLTNHWFINNRWHYEVHWKGYSKEERTYEPHCNLTDCLVMLSEYYKDTFGDTTLEDIDAALMEMRRLVDLSLFDKRETLHAFLDKMDLNFEKHFQLTKLDALDQKISVNLNAVGQCLAIRNTKPDAPDDDELKARGVALATVQKLILRRRAQLAELQAMEDHINAMEEAPIVIENNEDLDGFPTNFNYTTEMVLGEGVDMVNDSPVFCSCEVCTPKSDCCSERNGLKRPYNAHGRLNSFDRSPIWECNKNCKCPPSCHKRLVQHGRKVPLCLFKTVHCGWGVKAVKRIAKGTYLCEYLGEMVTAAVSNSREVEYSAFHHEYVFDLDFSETSNEAEFSVDATKIGNVARFINHGCSPNAFVLPVWVDCLDVNKHKLCIFTQQEIRAGEEICFDYTSSEPRKPEDPYPLTRTKCMCGAPNCRLRLFTKGPQPSEEVDDVDNTPPGDEQGSEISESPQELASIPDYKLSENEEVHEGDNDEGIGSNSDVSQIG